VELPHRHPLRGNRGGLDRRQHRDLQALLQRDPGGVAALPMLLAGRRLSFCPPPAKTPAAGSRSTPRWTSSF
jgi:hypothetical protein